MKIVTRTWKRGPSDQSKRDALVREIKRTRSLIATASDAIDWLEARGDDATAIRETRDKVRRLLAFERAIVDASTPIVVEPRSP